MHRALVDQYCLGGGLDAGEAIHLLIGELRLLAGDHHADAADPQAGRRPDGHACAAIERPGAGEAPVVQAFDRERRRERRVAGDARLAAEPDREFGADTHGVCRARGGGVHHQSDGCALRTGGHQRSQHAGGVGIAAGAGIVLRVGDDYRPRGALRDRHREPDAVVGCEHLHLEIGLGLRHQRRDPVGRAIHCGDIGAESEDRRPATGKISRGKPGRERHARNAIAF